MPSIKVSPTEGFVLECALGIVAVSGTVACIQGETDALPLCIGAWFMTLVNIPQAIRFFSDKPARKYYSKFNRAVEILRNEKASEEKKKKAFDTIVEAARGNYRPAIDLLDRINNS